MTGYTEWIPAYVGMTAKETEYALLLELGGFVPIGRFSQPRFKLRFA